MKVTSVELQPANSSNTIVLSFRDPTRANPYNVKNIVGLDADELTPRFYGISGAETSAFYEVALRSRELVFLIELSPNFGANQTVAGLRDDVYKLISSSRSGLLNVKFKNGATVVAVISGFVEKLEASHFSKTPEVQITIKCKQPLLRSPARENIVLDGFVPVTPAAATILDDVSTAPHGFQFDIEFTGAMPAFTIEDPGDPLWSFEVRPFAGFLTGDVLHFSSETDNKFLTRTRTGVTTHIAESIVAGSIWPIIFPGENNFRCDTPGSLDWVSISHYLTYWGI